MSDICYIEGDNTSDSLSTQDKSSSPSSFEESSSHFAQLSDICNIEAISQDTKKIKKKRCAYDKIDDEKRIQLLIAVQKNGESLKAASKKLKINYSSAKSILYTYRKEGRILKKSPLEIGTRPLLMADIDPSLLRNDAGRFSHSLAEKGSGSLPGNDPMRSLTSIFENLDLGDDETGEEPNFIDLLLNTTESSQEKACSEYKLHIPNFNMAVDHVEGLLIPSFIDAVEHDNFDKHDIFGFSAVPLQRNQSSFYMKYSASPLSAGKAVLFRQDSNLVNTQRYTRDFDSFGELATAFQMDQKYEEIQEDHHVPPLCKTDSQEIENLELANFVPMIDQEWFLCKGLMEVSPSLALLQAQRFESKMVEGDATNNQEIKA